MLHIHGGFDRRRAAAYSMLFIAGAIVWVTPAAATESGSAVEIVTVTADRTSDLTGIAHSASEGVVGAEDLVRRPILRPGEIVEDIPGVIVTQHSGSGKANQYFLRGFNLDHGTDLAISLDGVGVNLPTHAHGQGYADLNFLIPELVEQVSFKKGPYCADVGDFGAAGAFDIRYTDRLPTGIVRAEGGTNGYGRLLVANNAAIGDGTLLYAGEISTMMGRGRVATMPASPTAFCGSLTAGSRLRSRATAIAGTRRIRYLIAPLRPVSSAAGAASTAVTAAIAGAMLYAYSGKKTPLTKGCAYSPMLNDTN